MTGNAAPMGNTLAAARHSGAIVLYLGTSVLGTTTVTPELSQGTEYSLLRTSEGGVPFMTET